MLTQAQPDKKSYPYPHNQPINQASPPVQAAAYGGLCDPQ